MKWLTILMVVLLAGAAQAVDHGVVNNSGSDGADSISIPFYALDSTGNMVAMASGDSVFLYIFYPTGALAYQDSVAYNGTPITAFTVSDYTEYTWKSAVETIDGSSPTDGAYSYILLVNDQTGAALASPHTGTFWLYTTRDLEDTYDFVDQAVSSIDADVWTVASRTLTVADWTTDTDLDTLEAALSDASIGDKVWTDAGTRTLTGDVNLADGDMALIADTIWQADTAGHNGVAASFGLYLSLPLATVDDIWDEDTTGHGTAQSFAVMLKDTSAYQLTAAAAADAVWDEDTTGHYNVGTYGYEATGGGSSPWNTTQRDSVLAALADANIADKVWDADTTGHYNVGTYGYEATGGGSSPWNTTQRDSVLAALADANIGDKVWTDAVTRTITGDTYTPDVNVTSVAADAIEVGDIQTDAINGDLLANTAIDEIWEYAVSNITTADGIGDSLMSLGDSLILVKQALKAVRDSLQYLVTATDVNVTSVATSAIQIQDMDPRLAGYSIIGTVEDSVSNSATMFQSDLADTDDDAYNRSLVFFLTGTGKDGQVRVITDYTGASGVVYVDPGFVGGAPNAGDSFAIVGVMGGIYPNNLTQAQLALTATGEAGVDLDNISGTLDAAEVGADLIDLVWDEDTTGHYNVGTYGYEATSGGSSPWNTTQRDSVLAALADASIADKVWDADTTGHYTAGTYGYEAAQSGGGGLDTLATTFVDRLMGRVADSVWKSLLADYDGVAGSFGDSAQTWGLTFGAGSGPNACSLYVYDTGASAVVAQILVEAKNSSGSTSGLNYTNSDGYTVLSLTDGTYYIYIPSNVGYVQTTLPETLTYTSGSRDTIEVTAFDPANPAAAGTGTLYGYIYDVTGTALSGAIVEAEIPRKFWPVTYSGTLITPFARADTTDSNGYWSIDLYQYDVLSDTTAYFLIKAIEPSTGGIIGGTIFQIGYQFPADSTEHKLTFGSSWEQDID